MLPDIAARYERKTDLLHQTLYLIGYALGDEAGAVGSEFETVRQTQYASRLCSSGHGTSTENMIFVKPIYKKDFVMPFKENRKVITDALTAPNDGIRLCRGLSANPTYRRLFG